MTIRKLLSAFVVSSVIVAISPGIVKAQYFGKNKVQYTTFDWSYIQSDHFDVYFANDGYDIAVFTARAGEDALEKIQKSFKYEIAARVPIIVYNSHNDFQQTNVVGLYLEEGIGGVTELFKNRVVIPFEGSYNALRHVLHHELVHAVINDMFYGGSFQAAMTNRLTIQLPLWANEGMAEYQSRDGWDKDSDQFMRDAVTSNYLPPIPYLGGYFAYRGGQSVWWYISEKYGKEKIGEVLNSVRTMRNMDAGLKNTIGLSLEELSERWQRDQKKLYYPDVVKREAPVDFAKRMTGKEKKKSFYNTSPAISPRGDRIAFISNRTDYFGLYVMSAIDGSDVEMIVEGSNTADFEELHLLTPGITWSPDGEHIALAAKAGADDKIHILNVESGEQRTLRVARDGIYSVQWSRDGNQLAYVGNSSRQSDIWMFDMDLDENVNLTNDIFSDETPSWSPDGRFVYFVSDRKGHLGDEALPEDFDIYSHDYSQMDLYRVEVATGSITRLTDTPDWDESYPVVAPDGKRLLFISNKNGINNIYVYELETGREYPVTNSLTGIYQMSLSYNGKRLAFSTMFEAGFEIFTLKNPFSKPELEELEPTEFLKRRSREREAPLAGEQEEDRLFAAPEPREDRIVIGTETYVERDDVSIRVGQHEPEADSLVTGNSGSFMFGTDLGGRPESGKAFAPMNNRTDDGGYVINKYKLSFTTDMVHGNAGFSTFYGVVGTAQMTFSDMLGDHKILVMTNLIGDLKNSDYALGYFYLPDRIDWGLHGFHSARYLYGPSRGYYDNLYRYRQYGVGLTASYGIDKFNRYEGTATLMTITQENLDDPLFNDGSSTMVVPNFAYVHDNTLWGFWAPVRGTRYELRMTGSPGLGNTALKFISLSFDYRTYLKFMDDNVFVVRAAGGGSYGENAQRFFIGGTENWINRRFETGRIPIRSAEDFAFLTAVLPLRGFNYNARVAERFLLANLELRFPLVRYFLGGFLPYILQSINGAMFVDCGAALDDFSHFEAFRRDAFGRWTYEDLLLGMGFGARMWFLGFPLRFDVAWPYLGNGFGDAKYYFSLGGDF